MNWNSLKNIEEKMTEKKIKILLIDDDEDDYVIIGDTLSKTRNSGINIDWAAGYNEAREMVQKRKYHICLMDYRLGDVNGIELMREFFSMGLEMPVIILTGQGDHDVDIQAMDEGAVDYLEKANLDSVQLERAIRYAIRNSDMLKALRTSEEKLRNLSSRILEAQENERKYVARELHDSIGSGLTAVRFALEQKINSMGRSTGSSGTVSLERIMEMIREIIEETQRISSNLRPSVLDTLGLLPAIRSFCRSYLEIYMDIQIETQLNVHEEDVPEKLKIICYRIVQETFNNAAKHSQASNLLLNISKSGDYLDLFIKDNGKGFDVEKTISKGYESTGMGLEGMIERVRLSGGHIEIRSQRGQGTTVKIRFHISKQVLFQ
jgi:signal transduction histidine kinase